MLNKSRESHKQSSSSSSHFHTGVQTPLLHFPTISTTSMSDDGDSENYLFKIVIVGDSAVGKSNLLSRYARNEFDTNSKATICVEFQTQIVEIDGKEVKSQIWDTSGQERFRAVTSAYYHGAFGSLVVYDISGRSTFDSVHRWLDELETQSETTAAKGTDVICRALRDVIVEEGRELAEEKGMFFMETSALNSTNVRTAFEIVIREIYNNVSRKVLYSDSYKAELTMNGVNLVGRHDGSEFNQSRKKSSCCWS